MVMKYGVQNVVVNVLNSALSSYVENLDPDQFNFGLLSGKVELKDLVLKSSILDDLDVPFRVIRGQIGLLKAEFPWMDLFKGRITLNIQDIYAVVTPSQQVKYNAEREKKKIFEDKMNQMKKFEEAFRKKAELQSVQAAKENTSYVERLLAQLVKNIQINIQNIHIRYEDKVSRPEFPFSLGLTLSKLTIVSTDENWVPSVVTTGDTSKVYKITEIEALALYWNSHISDMRGEVSLPDFLEQMQNEIATVDYKPTDFAYVLGPINASTRLRLNMKPECDSPPFEIPVVHLNLNMEKLAIGITKEQYRDILALGDSMDRLFKGERFRKYRPNVDSYQGHYKEWWHFAYNCVLEEEVKRRKRNWSWSHMKSYRHVYKKYKSYRLDTLTRKPTPEEESAANEMVRILDISSLILIGRIVEIERRRVAKKEEAPQAKSGWFSWFSGGSKTSVKKDENKDILRQVQEAMTPEEKKALHEAIGYQENAPPVAMPEKYVNMTAIFLLKTLEVEARDESSEVKRVLISELKGVKCRLDTRSAAKAMKVHIRIDELITYGRQQDEFIPRMISSEQTGTSSGLLEVLFETNPLDKSCGQRLHVTSQPLKIIYDAHTINKVIQVFKAPASSALDQLQSAAESGIANMKEKSVTGLQYAIDKNVFLDLNVNIAAPIIIVPYGGRYTGYENVIVVNLGNAKIYSIPRDRKMNVRDLHAQGIRDEAIMEAMMSQSYDEIRLELNAVQLLIAQSDEDWKRVIMGAEKSDMHVLTPVNLSIALYKCLITDDPRLPHVKITGELPRINVTLSDARLLLILSLASSIPFKAPDEDEETEEESLLTRYATNLVHGSSSMVMRYLDLDQPVADLAVPAESPLEPERTDVQFTIVDLKFIMSEFEVSLHHQADVNSEKQKMLAFKLESLECAYNKKTFVTTVDVGLRKFGLQHFRRIGDVEIISTPPLIDGAGDYLFKVTFTQVDKKYFNFHTVYKSCESILDLKFAMLNIILNQDALVSLITYTSDIQQQVEEILNPQDNVSVLPTLKRSISAASVALSNAASRVSTRQTPRPERIVVETIKFKLCAELKEVSVQFVSDSEKISMCAIKGINTEVITKSAYTQVNARLQEVVVIDLSPDTVHDMILSVIGSETMSVQVVMYNVESHESDRNMDIKVTTGGLRIVFLNRFVTNMLNFLDHFQTAQQKILEASQAAAETAKQNVQNVYAQATKMSLQINLKAPDIIVPVNSNSYDAVLLDMGHITIVNKFLNLDIKSQENNHAVLENMKINLTNFKLARVKLDTHCSIICEETLLQPITLKLAMKRNLSASWYKAIPDLDISGQMQHIELDMSQRDYQMIMKTLDENLSEGKSETKTTRVTATQTERVASKADSRMTAVSNMDTTVGDIEPAVHTFLRFTFSMEKLVIRLYTGGPEELTPETIALAHNEAQGLGQFSLEGLAIKGRILTDNSIITSVLLLNCLLDDIRKGREDMLNRLIERKYEPPELDATNVSVSTDSLSHPKSMLDVTFQMKNGAMFVDVRIYSFTIIFSMEYMMRIADFFKQAETDEIKPLKAEESKVLIKTKSDAQVGMDQNSQMTINLKIEKPDIILVEHMNSIETNAMMLQCLTILKLRMSGSHQVISGSVSDLEIFACCYNPEKRAETKCDVLYPVTISLAGSTPENKGLHMEVMFTDIRLSVTPYIIELLNRVLAAMSSTSTTEAGEESELNNYEKLWVERYYRDDEFWFLEPDVAAEATEEIEEVQIPESATVLAVTVLQELCILSIPSIVITVEVGTGNKTVPMLLLNSSFKGNVRNWSSQMLVDSSLTLQMGYYNSALAMWEPLVEPVEVFKQDKSTFVPWELRLEVSMSDQDDQSAMSPTEEEAQQQQAVMSIDIISENNLELTVTKTFLEILNVLSKAFSTALEQGLAPQEAYVAPYKIVNQTGGPVTVMLNKSSFIIHKDENLADVVLEDYAEVPIKLRHASDLSNLFSSNKEVINATLTKDYSLFVQVQLDEKTTELELPVVRADKRFFMLNYRGEGNDNWGLISDIKIDGGVTVITLRSILQVYNHFTIPVEVYYMTSRGDQLKSIAVVEPGGVLNVPLKAVYTPTKELFFSVNGYTVTTSPYIWKDLQTNLSITKLLECTPKSTEQGSEKFILKAVGEMEQIYFESTVRHTMASTCYNIHLRPAVTLKNLLPLEIICCVENTVEEKAAEAGETLQLPHIEPGVSKIVFRLPSYLEKEWSCRFEVPSQPTEFSVIQFNSYDSAARMSMDLGLHTTTTRGSLILSLYCPFWMLNKTNLLLSYRKSKKLEKQESTSSSPAKNPEDQVNVLHHPPHFKGPVLFSFHAKNFFGKKKASIRVDGGEWSDKFSLDVAGSSGVVTCKANERIYQIGVRNQLTYNGFTKQITFTPFYVIINEAPFAIECQENDRPSDPWIHVEPKSCAALWPYSDLDNKLLRLRVAGTTEVTAPFLYTESHLTLLKLNNKFGGINVDIQVTESGFYINLAHYEHGMAPALLINHTQYTMNYWEKESVQMRQLRPKHCVYYTWDNPSGPRVMVWEGGQKKEIENDLRRDGVEGYPVTENYTVYWVSFLYGMQRVLLFTDNKSVAADALSAKELELIDKEITVSFHGLGLSLINNETRQEVLYLGIASSGVIWETCKMKGRRFKPMSSKQSAHIEAAYQRYLLKCEQMSSDSDLGREIIDDKIDLDFKLGQMFKPHKRLIRRTFQTGLWLQMKTNPTQLQLHGKINRLQIDNQMYDSIFPVVLAPVPPPKSVAIDSGIKPFAEVSIVQLLVKNSQIKQFKYFKVLIQEFHVKVDMGFLSAIQNLQASEKSDEEERNLFLTDMKLVDEELYKHVSIYSLQEQKSFYDLLHFSPLKIHVSFSMAGKPEGESGLGFLDILTQSVGVTLADMQDLVFKLAYFEREYVFLTNQQLQGEVFSHYLSQIIKQIYVIVFGLDVVGNPYGFVVGLSKGVEDLFYEPFQGAIQGPDEFAEGLALGMKSLVGHTVGGVADAASRITGTVGRGVAALTFDKDYQRKRREQLNKKPATIQEGLARSGKGLVMGFVDGFTGVFTKPASGWKEEGAGGLLKGLGKGCVGLVARPTAGVIDFASGSLNTIKRATEVGEEIQKLRPPRFLHGDGLVRPFKWHEAEGNKLLMDLEKGKYASTDIYCAHYIVIEKKEALLLTNKRLAYVAHNDIFGGWQVEWSYTWNDLQHPAKVVPKGVAITTSEGRKKKLGVFGSNDTQKVILISDPGKREEICKKIESLRGSS